MKNSKINPEELLKELESALDLIHQVDNIDLEKTDINKIKILAQQTGKKLKEKYKDILPEEPEDNLDTEE